MNTTPQQARVLVVEDDPNNMLVATKLLEVAGVPSENIFTSEGDPLPYLRQELDSDLDLILLDLQLPGKNGYTILQEIRSDPQLDGITVVALTANVMKHDIEQARQAGFDGFIGKPINGPRFQQWIPRILAGESVWTIQ